MNGPNWNVFVTVPRFPATFYQVLCGRSRTSRRQSLAGGILSLGMGLERKWLRSTSPFALCVMFAVKDVISQLPVSTPCGRVFPQENGLSFWNQKPKETLPSLSWFHQGVFSQNQMSP